MAYGVAEAGVAFEAGFVAGGEERLEGLFGGDEGDDFVVGAVKNADREWFPAGGGGDRLLFKRGMRQGTINVPASAPGLLAVRAIRMSLASVPAP